ncbi:hypothetical protein [Streptomyces hyaluromycini]|uniref:hypothetical protein n=1 Tax=Streptomyces hyaluromycini TaxID=1377993 RepID=UPI000B5C6BD5|nr:hypothetical protein [Streptomyces hyaluromycini]
MTAREEERALVSQIEGHLLLAATREEGRRAAARLADRIGWLTDTQRTDLERHFEAEYLDLARASWQRTTKRGEQLRREYETRYQYQSLRQRLLACFLLTCALLTATALLGLAA